MSITNRPALLAAAFLLAGCAVQGDPKPAVCDGKHRRPANAYGSVLPTAPAGSNAGPVSGDAAKPPPLGPLSSIDPASFLRCGAKA